MELLEWVSGYSGDGANVLFEHGPGSGWERDLGRRLALGSRERIGLVATRMVDLCRAGGQSAFASQRRDRLGALVSFSVLLVAPTDEAPFFAYRTFKGVIASLKDKNSSRQLCYVKKLEERETTDPDVAYLQWGLDHNAQGPTNPPEDLATHLGRLELKALVMDAELARCGQGECDEAVSYLVSATVFERAMQVTGPFGQAAAGEHGMRLANAAYLDGASEDDSIAHPAALEARASLIRALDCPWRDISAQAAENLRELHAMLPPSEHLPTEFLGLVDHLCAYGGQRIYEEPPEDERLARVEHGAEPFLFI